MRRSLLFVVAMAVTSSIPGIAQRAAPADDPILGTWKLNVAKSTYNSGPPPPATAIDVRRFSLLDGGWNVFVLTGVTTLGDPTLQVVTFKIDGTPYPVHNATTIAALLATGQPTNVTRSYRRVDRETVEFITYTDGVAGLPARRTVAKDGRTYTQTVRARNAKGEIVENVTVFDRVR